MSAKAIAARYLKLARLSISGHVAAHADTLSLEKIALIRAIIFEGKEWLIYTTLHLRRYELCKRWSWILTKIVSILDAVNAKLGDPCVKRLTN